MSIDNELTFGEGIRMLLDGHYRFVRSGLRVYLRVQNFNNSGGFQELGVPLPAATDSGYTDIMVDPPPAVTDVSMHNIGMSGGKLLMGARSFKVNHSFVLAMRDKYKGIPDDISVFFNWDGTAKVVGFVYENRMHEIVTYKHTDVAGETISWTLTCNRVDVPLDAGTQIQE